MATSFNLSLAEQDLAEEAKGRIVMHANKDKDKTVDPKTGEIIEKDFTDDGTAVNKSKAPKLMLHGPMGHAYTQMLDEILTMESMSAIVAATNDDETVQANMVAGSPTGYTATSDGGQSIAEQVGDGGYVYVLDSNIDAESGDKALTELMTQRNAHPNADMGLAFVHTGTLSHTAEALMNHANNMGMKIAISKNGTKNMITKMVRGITLRNKGE